MLKNRHGLSALAILVEVDMHYCTPFNKMGPGGWKCPCCGPSPLHKKFFKRMVKRRERLNWKAEIRNIGLVA